MPNRRILVINDHPAIYADICKVLSPASESAAALARSEHALFSAANAAKRPHDTERHVQTLEALRNDGIRIAIDDFGTGYSSLSYLRRLPLDCLKIDRSFIRNIDTSASDEAIVGAILAMAHALDLEVIAEGIETPEQLQVLGRHGCATAQGFYFSRPLPADQCRELLLEAGKRSSFTDTLRLRAAENLRGR